MGTPFYKQGVTGRDLKKPIRRMNKAMCAKFGDIFVTSTGESAPGRIVDSLHYNDNAEDIRYYAINREAGVPVVVWIQLDDLKELSRQVSQTLGVKDGFDIVEYENFYHIEWDPKE